MSKEKIAIEALERISNPMKYLKDEADKDGAELNGPMAMQIIDSSNFYIEIATNALKEISKLDIENPNHKISIQKPIRIFDDTGKGETIEITNLISQTSVGIVAEIDGDRLYIYKEDGTILSKKYSFYYAENY